MGAIRDRSIAIRNLKKLTEDPSKVLFIHYSQSKTFDDDEYGAISPVITSIVIKSLDEQIDMQFAIHLEADKAEIPKDQIQDSYRELEMRILKSYNEFVRRASNCLWVHWDMKNIHFGFEAIKHRFEKIGLPNYAEVSSSQKLNLRVLLEGMYGDNFVNGPDQMKSLLLCNSQNVNDPRFLDKDVESLEFEKMNFDLVIQSVDTKVDFLRRATKKLSNKKLIVLNKNEYAIFVDVVNHPVITFIGWTATVAGLILTVYALLK